jgi:hypothetical protein
MQRSPVRLIRWCLPAAGAAIAGAEAIFIELAGQRSTQSRHDVGFGRCGQHSAFERTEHVAHDAGRIENDVHQDRRNGHLAVAQLVEQIFGQVTQRDEFRCIQEPGAPLDGVKAAEYLVQQTPVVRRLLKIDQLVVDAGQKVRRLDKKVLQQIFHSLKVTHLLLLWRAEASTHRAPSCTCCSGLADQCPLDRPFRALAPLPFRCVRSRGSRADRRPAPGWSRRRCVLPN